MLLNGKIIILVEQQSSINENMPLRFLEYICRLYEKTVPLEIYVKVYNYTYKQIAEAIQLPVEEIEKLSRSVRRKMCILHAAERRKKMTSVVSKRL